MYAVVLFLFLWVLFQVVSIDARCYVEDPDPRKLYILKTTTKSNVLYNTLIKELDSRFFNDINILSYPERHSPKIYNIKHYEVLEDCSSHLMEVMEDAKNLRYMIHLDVKDFYFNNYNAPSELGYAWSGDVDCDRRYCSVNKKVKLVSNAVASIQSLYNLTLNLPKKDYLTHFIILVCSKDYYYIDLTSYTTFSYFDAESIKITYQSIDCNEQTKVTKNTIAVVAPNPSYIKVNLKPVVFYEESYVMPKTAELYEYSVMQVTSWKTFAHVLFKLVKIKSWRRVAILSDYSEKSIDIEQELRNLFSEKSVSFLVFAAKRTKEGYDFSEALDTLKRYDARIIVANVEDGSVGTLALQAEARELTSSHKVLWLAPGWSEDAAKTAAMKMGSVLNFVPTKTDLEKDILLKIKHLINNKQFEDHYDYRNSKVFARDLASYLHRNDSIDVIQFKSRGDVTVVATITNSVTLKNRFFSPRDRQDDCLISSPNYYKPCDDMVVMYILLVIMVFAVTILGVTYFFQTSSSSYNRM